MRREIENEIERLIALLDLIDGDPDLEPTGDCEPWLACPENHPLIPGSGRQVIWCQGGARDLEADG